MYQGLSSIGFLKNANLESERLIKSLHKIHGIKTRVPKRFRVSKVEKEGNGNGNENDKIELGIPTEIKIVRSRSSDNKEVPNIPTTKKKRNPKKTEKTKNETGRRRKSVVQVAKAAVDPNMFLLDDSKIIADLEELTAASDEKSGRKQDTLQDENSVKSFVIEENMEDEATKPEVLPETEVKIDASSEVVDESGINKTSTEDVAVSYNKDKLPIFQQNNVSQQESTVGRQVSRQKSWFGAVLSRQSSWISRQDSDVDEEPDEESAEEKAARIASLRYYPIGFNVEQ